VSAFLYHAPILFPVHPGASIIHNKQKKLISLFMNTFISGEYPSHLTKLYIKIKCIFYLPITTISSSSFLAIAIKKVCQINFTLCMHTIGNDKFQNHREDNNQKLKKKVEKPISSINKAKKRKYPNTLCKKYFPPIPFLIFKSIVSVNTNPQKSIIYTKRIHLFI
jgi:hypothetical protein